MGKQSRRKRERRTETRESRAFREQYALETMWEALGEKRWEYDRVGLAMISNLVDVARDLDGEWIPVIEPLRAYDDHMEFDRAICAAGVKRFMRRTMPSDQPGYGTPLNPQTMEPDPTIPVPDFQLDEFLVVWELSRDIRARRGVTITARGLLIPSSGAP
jgi:hypothetical protein